MIIVVDANGNPMPAASVKFTSGIPIFDLGDGRVVIGEMGFAATAAVTRQVPVTATVEIEYCKRYRIVGYSNSLLTMPGCNAYTGNPVWKGDFGKVAGEACWTPHRVGYGAIPIQINGKDLTSGISGCGAGATRIYRSAGTWYMDIYCDSSPSSLLVWSGDKAAGDTPAGTYTRTGGSDSTATLDVECGPTHLQESTVTSERTSWRAREATATRDLTFTKFRSITPQAATATVTAFQTFTIARTDFTREVTREITVVIA